PPPELSTLSLHDALPIFGGELGGFLERAAVLDVVGQACVDQVLLRGVGDLAVHGQVADLEDGVGRAQAHEQADALEDQEGDQGVDRKSTRLNSSHSQISY